MTKNTRRVLSIVLSLLLVLSLVSIVGMGHATAAAPANETVWPTDKHGVYVPTYSGAFTSYSFDAKRGEFTIEFDITPLDSGTAGLISFSNYISLLRSDSSSTRAFELELQSSGNIRLVGGSAGTGVAYVPGIKNHIVLNVNTRNTDSLGNVSATIQAGNGDILNLGTVNFRNNRNNLNRIQDDDVYNLASNMNIGAIGVLASVNSFKIENFKLNGEYQGLGGAVDPESWNDDEGYVISVPDDLGVQDIYKVGPSRNYKKIQDVLSKLKPGDTIEVDGDFVYPGGVQFSTAAGTPDAPITIKGITVNGKKPTVKSLNAREIMNFTRPYYILDNFDVEGSLTDLLQIFKSVTVETIAQNNPRSIRTEIRARVNYCAVNHASENLVVRNCKIHDARMGMFATDGNSGDLLLEYCDIYRNGAQNGDHNIYIATDEARYPDAASIVRYNYVHNSVSGNGLKTRSAKNLVYYNVFEDNFNQSLELIGPDPDEITKELKGVNADYDEFYVREDSDVVGNLIIHRDAPYIHNTLVRCGGDGTGQSYGRYRFVNNTFIMQNTRSYQRFIRAEFGVESFEFYNNVFYAASPDTAQIFADDDDYNHPRWASVSGGTGIGQIGDLNWYDGRRVVGDSNWVSTGCRSIPTDDEWKNTMYGVDPFVNFAGSDLLTGDFRVIENIAAGVPVDTKHTVKEWDPWVSDLYGFNFVEEKLYLARYGEEGYNDCRDAWFFSGETNRGTTVLDDGHFKGQPEMLNYEAINPVTFMATLRNDGTAPSLGAFAAGPARWYINISGINNVNKQSSVNFPIRSANGKGYTVYLAVGEDGEFAPYSNVNYNANGVHVKGLKNGVQYRLYVEYNDGFYKERSIEVTLEPMK